MADEHVGTLHANSLKVTPARKAILTYMQLIKKPVDVTSIMDNVVSQGIIVNQSTVYRILDIFIEHNLIRQIQFKEVKARYELATLPHHHHAVCTKCGLIEDIDACDVKVNPHATKKSSIKIESHALEFFGICKSCNSA